MDAVSLLRDCACVTNLVSACFRCAFQFNLVSAWKPRIFILSLGSIVMLFIRMFAFMLNFFGLLARWSSSYLSGANFHSRHAS